MCRKRPQKKENLILEKVIFISKTAPITTVENVHYQGILPGSRSAKISSVFFQLQD